MEIINRMKVSHRIGLIGLLALLLTLMPTLLFMDGASDQIGAARVEANGIGPSKGALRVVQLVQQHRGLSAMVLSGNARIAEQRKDKQGEVDRAMDRMYSSIELDPALGSIASAWGRLRDEWRALKADVEAGRLDAGTSFARHSALVGSLFKATDMLADAFQLSLDPEPTSYQLIQAVIYTLPQLNEGLGKSRALGAAMLTRRSATEQERRNLAIHVDRARANLEHLTLTMAKATAQDAQLRSRLETPLSAALLATESALHQVQTEVLDAEQMQFDPAAYFATMSAGIDAQVGLHGEALDRLEELLASRVIRLQKSLALLMAALSCLGALTALVGFYTVRSITRQLGGEPGQVMFIAGDVAKGNLNTLSGNMAADEHSIMAAMHRMQTALRQIVYTVRNSADAIATASAQIAQGNNDLAARTECEAGSLAQTAASMRILGAAVRHNAENAQLANSMASNACTVAGSGGQVVAQVVDTMREITESSNKISDIIGVIDGIAFQTNILALNASIEAARAGPHGRGFAVVASEVRVLAQRSAEAAMQIKGLIEASVQRVEQGRTHVDRAGEAMNDVIKSIGKVTGVVDEISAASAAQSADVATVEQSVAQMERTTQQNAALVEEMAAAAASLNLQAQDLVEAMGVFKLEGSALPCPSLAKPSSDVPALA